MVYKEYIYNPPNMADLFKNITETVPMRLPIYFETEIYYNHLFFYFHQIIIRNVNWEYLYIVELFPIYISCQIYVFPFPFLSLSTLICNYIINLSVCLEAHSVLYGRMPPGICRSEQVNSTAET